MEKESDWKKAQLLVCDKNYPLAEIAEKTMISHPSLKLYRSNPEKLRVAAWEKVNALARYYDLVHGKWEKYDGI